MENLREIYDGRFSELIGKQPECGNVDGSEVFFRDIDPDKSFRILDVGTYIGTFPYRIYNGGWNDVYGLDVGAESVSYGKMKYPDIADRLICYDGTRIPFGDSEFDVVTMFNLVEHLEDPASTLSEVHRIMKPGARLLIQTPNKPFDVMYETFKFRSMRWRKHHCSLQTASSLSRLLLEGGFQEVRLFKMRLDTPYFRGKLERYFGRYAVGILPMLSRLPASLSPVISASAVKR